MTDRPIILSDPMARALRDGRKTQTRRVLKDQPPAYCVTACVATNGAGWAAFDSMGHGFSISVPYAVGDCLWVREAWRTTDGLDQWAGAQIAAACADAGYKRTWAPIQYEADGARVNWIADPHTFGTDPGRYRHARHMPRWASRLTLTVTDVRVQRLQDISEADAVAEGVTRCAWSEDMTEDGRHEWHVPEFVPGEYPGLTNSHPTPVGPFAELWDKLHGHGAWDADPWVVALSFDVRKGNIDTTPHKEPTDD